MNHEFGVQTRSYRNRWRRPAASAWLQSFEGESGHRIERLTQEVVSTMLGYSESQYGHFEAGRRNPTRADTIKLIHIFREGGSITEVEQANELLTLLDYCPLTDSELVPLRFAQLQQPSTPQPVRFATANPNHVSNGFTAVGQEALLPTQSSLQNFNAEATRQAKGCSVVLGRLSISVSFALLIVFGVLFFVRRNLPTPLTSVNNTPIVLPTHALPSIFLTPLPTVSLPTVVSTSTSVPPAVVAGTATLTSTALPLESTPPAILFITATITQTAITLTPIQPEIPPSPPESESTVLPSPTPTVLSSVVPSDAITTTTTNETPEPSPTTTQVSSASILIVMLTDCNTMLPNEKRWKGELLARCDPAITHDGYPALWLNTVDTWAVVERYSPLIPVEPGQQYEVSYWVKTDVEFQLADMYGKVITSEYYSIAREEDAVNENRIGAGFATGKSIGDKTDWVQQSYLFTTRADTTYIRLRAVMGGPDQTGGAKGSMWISQLSLRKILK